MQLTSTFLSLLPPEAPTLSGVLTTSFNPVLLRGGYHWKDPGAGASHGEYTHRLQWYAILHGIAQQSLKLKNKAIVVFKSLGYDSVAKGSNENRIVFLWQLLCDCFLTTDGKAKAKGLPVSSTFTCPDVMNAALMGTEGKQSVPHLRTLMKARYLKRTTEPIDGPGKIYTGQKPVKYGLSTPTDTDKDDGTPGFLWWKLRG